MVAAAVCNPLRFDNGERIYIQQKKSERSKRFNVSFVYSYSKAQVLSSVDFSELILRGFRHCSLCLYVKVSLVHDSGS